MKFIIYWVVYTSTLGDRPEISGTIAITDTTVTAYLYPYRYLAWDIVEKQENSIGETLQSGHYLLERNHIKSVMVITSTNIYQYVATDPAIHIELKRKTPGRRHHKPPRKRRSKIKTTGH